MKYGNNRVFNAMKYLYHITYIVCNAIPAWKIKSTMKESLITSYQIYEF